MNLIVAADYKMHKDTVSHDIKEFCSVVNEN